MDNLPDRDERVDCPNGEIDRGLAERRSLMRKFAVGAFAVPVILATLSSKAAAAS